MSRAGEACHDPILGTSARSAIGTIRLVAATPSQVGLLITGGTIVGGTGMPARPGTVRIWTSACSLAT